MSLFPNSPVSSLGPNSVGGLALSHLQAPIVNTDHQHDVARVDTDLESTKAPIPSLPHDEEIRFDFDGVPYLSPNLRLGSIFFDASVSAQEPYSPLTVISIPTPDADTSPNITSLLKDNLNADDVLSQAWLSTLVVTADKEANNSEVMDIIKEEEGRLRHSFGVDKILVDDKIDGDPESPGSIIQKVDLDKFALPPTQTLRGPVLGKHERDGSVSLLPGYQLESDKYDTLVFGVIPTADGSFKKLSHLDPDGHLYFGIPSRLASNCDTDDGVCGKRILVKDLFDIDGVPTSAGSRIWGILNGPANATASSIQKLIDLGARIVGKTKTSSFGLGAWGTVDEHYPFSPRGDGWQTCMGSSSGSACALAAYPQVDIAIGTDQSGSTRFPAAITGEYGVRPSHGVLSMDGIVPLVPFMDTIGAFTRDPKELAKLMKSWYHNQKPFSKTPSRILVDKDYGTTHSEEVDKIYKGFLRGLESTLGAEIESIDLLETIAQGNWTKEKIQEQLTGHEWTSWNEIGKPFREKYAALHDGQLPSTDPAIRAYWDTAEALNVTQEQYDGIVSRLKSFTDLVNDEILGQDDESCSKAIYVYDRPHSGEPIYREFALSEELLNGTFDGINWMNDLMCPYTGCVDLTVPIGQAPHMSKISRQEEMTPVAVQLVARKGCDLMLGEVLERLAEPQTGLVSSVKTGRTAF